jgi:hypothetical protein
MVKLLAESNVDVRTDLLLDLLREQQRVKQESGTGRKFPPDFSTN